MEEEISSVPAISTFDAQETSLYLSISLKTTNILKLLFIHALVDSGDISIFINQSFVGKYSINTGKLSKSIPMYNVNGTLNKARQISKIVDVVLCYKTYTEGSLFAISSLYKQDLIFSFT